MRGARAGFAGRPFAFAFSIRVAKSPHEGADKSLSETDPMRDSVAVIECVRCLIA
jgi:hypothetical protein